MYKRQLVYRPVRQINQIQRRGEDEVLHPGQFAAVALFGDVARNQNKVDTVYRIYLRDGTVARFLSDFCF